MNIWVGKLKLSGSGFLMIPNNIPLLDWTFDSGADSPYEPSKVFLVEIRFQKIGLASCRNQI